MENGQGKGGIVGAAVKGALSGAAQGSGLISAPFRAAKIGGNLVQKTVKTLENRTDKVNKNKPVNKVRPKQPKEQPLFKNIRTPSNSGGLRKWNHPTTPRKSRFKKKV